MIDRSRRRTRLLTVALGLSAVVLPLAACSSAAPAEDAAATPAADVAQDVVFAISGDPTCLDPQQTSLTTSLNIGRQIVDSLLDQDPETGEIVPWLAEEWSSNDDLTQFSFTLADHVTFSDGTPLTSEVVAANFDAIMAMTSTGALAKGYLAGYTGTEIVDDLNFTVDFSAPNAQFEQGATTMSLGIVSAETAAATPEARCTTLIGSGPFVLDSYVANDSVEISAREGYAWGSSLRGHEGDAYLEHVSFPIIAEPSVRTGGLESGEYDIIQEVPFVDEPRFAGDEFHIYSRPNPGVPTSFVVNTQHGLLGEEAVRKAILLGIDRDEINVIAGALSGNPPTSVLTSSTPGYTDLGDELTYDPDAAADLLDEAGWIEGADGARTRDGVPLTVTVTAFYSQDAFEAAQIQLRDIGIDLQLNMVSSGDFFGAIASGDYDMLGAGLTRTDPDVLRVLLSPSSASRWGIVDDAELDQLLQAQATTADREERQEIVSDAQAMIIDRAYVIPALQGMQLHASRAGVEGIVFDSASRINLYDAVVTAE